MKSILRSIFIIILAYSFGSCALEEITEPVQDNGRNGMVEFVARPTSYIKSNVSTKATSDEISSFENDIHTAYFLVYDKNGALVSYKNLTSGISSDSSVPSQTVRTDEGLSEATVCYIANLPESVMKANMESTTSGITDLKKLQNAVLDITYADVSELGCIGVPAFDLDDNSSTPNVNCLPMFGSWTGDITGLSTSQTVEIPVKRLFAKVNFAVKLDLTGGVTGSIIPYLAFESFVINNLPTKVAMTSLTEENSWATSTTLSDFITSVEVPAYHSGEPTLKNNEEVSFFFYIPEYLVEPVIEGYENEDWYKDRDEGYKPLLAGDKHATYVSMNGVFYTVQGQYLEVDYKIYLGENNFDSFSLRRNYLYNNTISINGTTDGTFNTDHRVNIDYNAFLVGFERATLLDSHFEVRPLRVKFSQDFIEENNVKEGSLRDGILSVEILNADTDGGTKPSWIRLERPLLSETSANYCLGGANTSHTKRRYFTTDLVTSTLKDNLSVSYNPFSSDADGGDLKGNVPVWVYIDEYGATSTSEYSADATRRARIRVKYTPNDPSEEVLSQDFMIQQRAIYPIQATGWDGTTRTFGIEYFEEYLHDYDSQDNYGAEGGEYFTSQDGIPWGFDKVEISNTDRSLYFTGDAGYIDMNSLANLITADEPLYYDFYLTRDKKSSSDDIEVHDYSGYEFSNKIIVSEGVDLIDRRLNERTLSAVEYCYNKNKRNENGKVIYSYTNPEYWEEDITEVVTYYRKKRSIMYDYYKLTLYYSNKTYYTDTYISTSNCKWFLPAIDELEDIVTSGMRHDFFSEVFVDNLYWSSQPAYNRNYFQCIWALTSQYTDGAYLADNVLSARSTKYDQSINTFISSDVPMPSSKEGFYKAKTLYGYSYPDNSKTYPNAQDGDNVYKLVGTLSGLSVTWTNDELRAMTSYKYLNEDPIEMPEGIQPRIEEHRIRCIYNPVPPADQLISSVSRVVNESEPYRAKLEKSERFRPSGWQNGTTITSEQEIPYYNSDIMEK